MTQMFKILLSWILYIFLPPLCFLESTPSTLVLLPFLFCPFSAYCWLDSALPLTFWGKALVAGPSWRCPSAANSSPRGQGVQYTFPNSRLVNLPSTSANLTQFDFWPHRLQDWRFALWFPLSCHGTSQLWAGQSMFKHWNSTSIPHGLHRLSFLAIQRDSMLPEETIDEVLYSFICIRVLNCTFAGINNGEAVEPKKFLVRSKWLDSSFPYIYGSSVDIFNKLPQWEVNMMWKGGMATKSKNTCIVSTIQYFKSI